MSYKAKRLDKDPADETVLFNRAITAEHLYLFRQAIDDWMHYLNMDSSSEWSAEAHQHLDLVQKLVKAHEKELQSHLLSADDFWHSLDVDEHQASEEIEPRVEQYLDLATVTWLPVAFSAQVPSNEAGMTKKSLRALDRIMLEHHHDEWLADMLAHEHDVDYLTALDLLSNAIRANAGRTSRVSSLEREASGTAF